MPPTEIVYYRELDATVPVLDWLTELGHRDRQAASKCVARIELLRQLGHELRRPTADYLRDGIYELRIRSGKRQIRLLYFFQGRNLAVLAHGFFKEGRIPKTDIDRAIARKRIFERDPANHSYREKVR
jgi:phage-related protein